MARPPLASVGPGGELPIVSVRRLVRGDRDAPVPRSSSRRRKRRSAPWSRSRRKAKLIRPVFNWAGRNSLFPLHWGLACCAIEFAAAFGARCDAERFGVVPRSSPRQCDLLIVNGTVTWKVAHKLIALYEQMPEPKWVIAMGNCATGGGPFRTAYSVVPGVDKLVPVDVYIAGCPPRPEALLDGILRLEALIRERGA